MLQTLLWISRLEKTFGKNSSKSGQKYFAKCASYTSNYIESKSASINLFFPIYYLVHQIHSWNYESWLYFHEKKVCWCSNTWKLSFSIEIDSYINFFFYHCFHSQTEARFEQVKFYVTNSGFVDTRLVFSIWRISYYLSNNLFVFVLFISEKWMKILGM